MGNEWELEDPARSSHESSSTLSFHWLCYKTGVVTAPCLLPWTGQGGAQLYRPARVRAQPWVTQPGSEHSPALGKLCTVVPLPRRGQGASCRNGGGGGREASSAQRFMKIRDLVVPGKECRQVVGRLRELSQPQSSSCTARLGT